MDCSCCARVGAYASHVPASDDAAIWRSAARDDRYAGSASPGNARPSGVSAEAFEENLAEPEVPRVPRVPQVGGAPRKVLGATKTAAPRLDVGRRRDGILANPKQGFAAHPSGRPYSVTYGKLVDSGSVTQITSIRSSASISGGPSGGGPLRALARHRSSACALACDAVSSQVARTSATVKRAVGERSAGFHRHVLT